MKMDRRHFLKMSGALAAAQLLEPQRAALGAPAPEIPPDSMGCLVDTTLCAGCRKCEEACNKRYSLPGPKESFNEMTVLENPRRPDETSYTVVNKYYPKHIGSLTWRNRPTFVKFQCMHCNEPSCVSACIVGAMSKQENWAVTYDPSKCIGCRYCMIACPFQVPAFEYHNALTPQIRKCNFCFTYYKEGGLPACAQICPNEVMTFGKRSELLDLARWKMKRRPGKYVNHIYGENEVGGTSWLYLASEPFATIGFPKLGSKAPPRLTESIQHGLFQYMAAPIGLYLVLGGIMWATGYYTKYVERQKQAGEEASGKEASEKGGSHESQ